MIGKKADTFMHYCNGTWRDGFVLDCDEADEHEIKLVQSMTDYEKARFKLAHGG